MGVGMMKIGVLGGTFDPVHNGHIAIAVEVKAYLSLDEVIFVPAGRPWLKDSPPLASTEQRREMVRLAIAGEPGFKLSTVDIDRPGPTYTIDTITELQARLGDDTEFCFILGWGSLAELPRWHQPARLIEKCRLVAVPRPGYPPPDIKTLESAIPGISDRLLIMDRPLVDISATEIRRMVGRGEAIDQLVPEAVVTYIQQQGLYTLSSQGD
jgi:nicotinate-nucleotide adenylyltransferase